MSGRGKSAARLHSLEVSGEPTRVESIQVACVVHDRRVRQQRAGCTKRRIDSDLGPVAGAAARMTQVVVSPVSSREPGERVTAGTARSERLRLEECVVSFRGKKAWIAVNQ